MGRCLISLLLLLGVSCASVEQSVGKAAGNASSVMSGFMDSLYTTNKQGSGNDNNVGQRSNNTSRSRRSRKVSSPKPDSTAGTSTQSEEDEEDISGADRPGAF